MLGQFKIVDDSETEVHLRGKKLRALAGMLAANANQMVSVSRLIDALWESQPPRTAESNLRVYVYHLRNDLIEKDRIHWGGAGYQMRVEAEELDVNSFESLAAMGHRAMAGGGTLQALQLFDQALSCWRGQALLGLEDVAPLRPMAIRLQERRLAIIEWKLLAELLLGAGSEVVAELAALVAEFPLRENFRAMLMIALRRAGRVSEALSVYQEGWRRLDADLGITPGSSLRILHVSILNGDRGDGYLNELQSHVMRVESNGSRHVGA
jgi:DNA-binding SARP family transcriptional activator